jgi:hypothetical protein
MFERYTEEARRSIFFARYEASLTGSPHIETEHLLLGLLREDPFLRGLFAPDAIEKVRQTVEQRLRTGEQVATSADLPLSHECKRALAFGAEEAERLGDETIRGRHLALGLLRQEQSGAASLLREHGIELERFREAVKNSPAEPLRRPAAEVREARVEFEPDLRDLPEIPRRLGELLGGAVPHLKFMKESDGSVRLKRHSWTRREAMGHLIDWAAAHQVWFARAMTEPKVTVAGYPGEEWVAAQRYDECEWDDLVTLWHRMNLLLVHVLTEIPEARMQVPCKVGIENAIPLAGLMQRYVAHVQDVVGEVLMSP